MKRFTLKNLPPSAQKDTEDIRLSFANISFYAKYLVITTTEPSYGIMLMWADDMEKVQQTALSMWRNALVAKNAKAQMPELYSEQEIHEISDFIESVFGKYDYVFHEVASTDIDRKSVV